MCAAVITASNCPEPLLTSSVPLKSIESPLRLVNEKQEDMRNICRVKNLNLSLVNYCLGIKYKEESKVAYNLELNRLPVLLHSPNFL